MVLTTDELIYEQAKKTYDILVNRIEAFDEKSHRIFVMATTGFGILFLILPFIANIIATKNIISYPSGQWIIGGTIVAFIASASYFIFSLIYCVSILKLNKYSIMNTNVLYTEYGSWPNTPLLKQLITQINDFNITNRENAETIKWNYDLGLKALTRGFIAFAVFVFLAIMLIISYEMIGVPS